MKSTAVTLVMMALCAGAMFAPVDAAVEPGEVQAREAQLKKLRGALQALRDDLQKDIRKRDELSASLRDAEKRKPLLQSACSLFVQKRSQTRPSARTCKANDASRKANSPTSATRWRGSCALLI